MIRALFRIVGLAMLAGAFAAAVIDGARSIAADQLTLTPIGETAYWAFPNKFALMQATVTRIEPKLWDPLLLNGLKAPTWLVLSILGAALLYFTRRRPPPIGHSNRSR